MLLVATFLDKTEYATRFLPLIGLREKYIFQCGSFKNHMDIILLFFDHPPTLVDNFYVLNVDKNGKF